MRDAEEVWDYCTIKFSTYHNMGGGEHRGLNLGLLWFEATAKGPNGRYEAGKSTEIPFSRVSEGYPKKQNPAHISVHRELTLALKKDGWKPISGGGAGWWEKRFRREPREAVSSLKQKIRGYFNLKEQ